MMRKLMIYPVVLMFGVLFLIAGGDQVQGAIITTETGANGADAYVRGASYVDTNYGTSANLYVKEYSAGNPRKSYIRFDLSSWSDGTITAATLKLVLSSSLLNSDATIGVYGMPDGNPDTAWGETTITWNNAPLNVTNGNGFAAGATSLGSFTVGESDALGTGYDFTSAALIAFLNADTDNKVTIMMNVTGGGNIAGFASKEHATYNPPALDIVPEPATLCLLGLGGIGILLRRCPRA